MTEHGTPQSTESGPLNLWSNPGVRWTCETCDHHISEHSETGQWFHDFPHPKDCDCPKARMRQVSAA